MVSKVVTQTTRKIGKIETSLFVTLPAKWLDIVNIKEEDGEVVVALMNSSKHGYFLAVWNKNHKE